MMSATTWRTGKTCAEHSWDHDDGVEAPRSRDDAIDATAFSPTRRDGPDAVRNGSKSKKKPPTASSPGDDAPRRHDHGLGTREHTKLDHRRLVVDRKSFSDGRLERLDVVAQHRQADAVERSYRDGRRVLRVDFLFQSLS